MFTSRAKYILSFIFLSLPALAQTPPSGSIPSSFFGMTLNPSSSYPTVTLGNMGKQAGAEWPHIEPYQPGSANAITCTGGTTQTISSVVHCFYWAGGGPNSASSLDAYVTQANSHSIPMIWMYEYAPAWANGSVGCGGGGGSAFECTGPVTDLTNMSNFATALATRYNGSNGHGTVNYFELANESFTGEVSYSGTFEQFAVEKNTLRTAILAGNGSAIVGCCGESAADDSFVTGGSMDKIWGATPTGLVKTLGFVSYHAYPHHLDDSPEYVLGNPSCVVDNGGSNEHGFMGTTVCVQQGMARNGVSSSIPIFMTEGSWADSSYSNCANNWGGGSSATGCQSLVAGTTYSPGSATGAAIQSAFVSRYFLELWASGVSWASWYGWPSGLGFGSLGTAAQTAWQQTYNWMVGSTMTSPCALISGSTTILSCAITESNGTQALAVWNTAGAGTFTITAGQWAHYRDLTGATTVISGTATSVNISIQPILLEGVPPVPYHARTDLSAAEPGATLTSMGGCTGTNNTAHDDLGNGLRILRISDCNFNPAKPNKPITMGVGGSSDTNQFSQSYTRSGHTHYLLSPEDSGTGTYVTDLDYTAFTSSRIYVSSFPSSGGLTLPNGGCDWAYTSFKTYCNPSNLLQSVDLTDWVSGGQSTPPSVVNVFDYTETTSGLPDFGNNKCLAAGFTGQTWNADGTHSKDDQTFASAFSWYPNWAATTAYGAGTIVRPSTGNAGNFIYYSSGGTSGSGPVTWPQTQGLTVADGSITWTALVTGAGQGTGNMVAVYRVGQGCTTLNTTTGAVSGDWGSTGTITQTDRMLIHNIKISKDGNWLIIQTTLCGLVNSLATCNANISPEVWQIGTTNMPPLATSAQHGGGHWTEGYTHWINGSSFPNPPGHGGYTIRPFSNGSAYTDIYTAAQMPSGISSPWDGHYGYNNADLADSVPFVGSQFEGTPPTYEMGQISCGGTTSCTLVSGHVFSSSWTGSIYIGGSACPSQICTISGTPTSTTLSLTTAGPSGTVVYSFAPITYAWPREIQAVNPTNGTTYRFSHTFVSGEDAGIFNAGFAIGSVSQDGKLWAGTSDWLGTLGSTSGASTCTTTTDCRSDVFVFDLVTSTVSPPSGVSIIVLNP